MVEPQQQHGSRFMLLDLVLISLSALSYINDISINFIVVHKYFYDADYMMAAIFALLVFLPGFITSIMSCLWSERNSLTVDSKLPTVFPILRILAIVFLLSPLSG